MRDEGIYPIVREGYRTAEYQQETFDEKVQAFMNEGYSRFSGLAHPQSLQCYGAYPQKDYRHIYIQLAQALCANGMYIEESSGLAINYGDKQLGMNQDMLECMVKYNVPILTASDAHLLR